MAVEQFNIRTNGEAAAHIVDSGILKASNVVVSFEGLMAIDGLSLSLRGDRVLGLIGPNGAGKTTLINVLTGFQKPDFGQIHLDGQDVTRWKPHQFARHGIARSFQNVRLYKEYTVLENLEVNAVGVGLSRREAHRRAMEVLDWFGLGDKASMEANALAYGDERRVGVARALAMGPRFLLLDEPAAGMNEAECDVLMDVISRIPETFGCSVLVIEHNMRVIMNICEHIHVIDFGKVIADGTPEEIRADPTVISAYLDSKGK